MILMRAYLAGDAEATKEANHQLLKERDKLVKDNTQLSIDAAQKRKLKEENSSRKTDNPNPTKAIQSHRMKRTRFEPATQWWFAYSYGSIRSQSLLDETTASGRVTPRASSDPACCLRVSLWASA